MPKTNIKIEKDLVEKVKTIAENKYPLRNIDSYAEAIRESLIEFIKKNSKYLVKDTKPNPIENIETIPEETI